MHYKNGRQAKNGDVVVMLADGAFNPPKVGILYGATTNGGNDCNGRIAMMKEADPTADLKNSLHLDDVAGAAIPDLTVPFPTVPDATANVENPPPVNGAMV